MEKPVAAANNAKKKLLKFLPKAASAVSVSFQNPPFSPGRDKIMRSHAQDAHSTATKVKSHMSRGFSGPVISIIPAEARSRSSRIEYQEPTSPKVSCIGQIKHRRKVCKKKPVKDQILRANPGKVNPVLSSPADPVKKLRPSATFKSIFSHGKKETGRKSDASSDRCVLPDRAPSLSQMKRFASSRDVLRDFDWSTATDVVDDDVHRRDKPRYCSDECSDEEEEEVIVIPFSAPLMGVVGGGPRLAALEPRKEINLWKRRTMAQPTPLKLNTLVGSH